MRGPLVLGPRCIASVAPAIVTDLNVRNLAQSRNFDCYLKTMADLSKYRRKFYHLFYLKNFVKLFCATIDCVAAFKLF